MRPYIIINGKNSNNINGLLISTLPPIVKAQKRIEVEEIDGRDGDIVTPLGFSAYDRDIEIGLKNQYDVNDIISFFDSQGEVIFSNEPNLYYRFAIYNQISFEKLIRFKKAVVTFHCQPFKYSVDDTMRTKTFVGASSGTMQIRNHGNYKSEPRLTLTGSGVLNVFVNDSQIFQIDMPTAEKIVIDAETMEAYNGTTLLNRRVVGNYDNFYLPAGLNEIKVTGSVTSISIENYTRFI